MITLTRGPWAVAGVCLLVATTALCHPAVADDRDANRRETAKLIAVLESNSSLHDKAVACKQLAVLGSPESVPALAALLPDEALSHYARFGLEGIASAEADAALRNSISELKGQVLIGVINSIGNRRDVKAIDALTVLLGNRDIEVGRAAAGALGRIGGLRVAGILLQGLSTAPPFLRESVADACLVCADGLVASGHIQEGIGLYDALGRAAHIPERIRLAALRGALLSRQSSAIPLLLVELGSESEGRFRVALRAAREMSAQRDEIVRALVGEFPKLPPARQALVLLLLGDLQDRRALPLVFSAVQSAPTDVRAAAVRSLRQLGDVSVVPLLLKVAAADPEETIALEAQNVLRSLPGREMDATLLSALQQSDGRTQLVLIGIVGYRRIEVAWPILLKFADDEQPQVRLAALAALGETATLDGLPTLTSRIIGSQSAEEGAAVREALKVACVRMPDRDACAEKLAASLAEAPPAAKTMLLDLLGSVGGSTALAAVARSARDPDASVQDAATRVLGEWLSADAAPELLDLAQTLDDDRLKTRALRGYIRVIRQLGLPAEERISMCREALRVAKRDEERKLLMEVLGRNPSVEGLSLVVPYLGQPRLRNEASAAIIAIAEKIAPADRNAAEDALRRVLQSGASDEAKARAQTMLNQGGQ